MKPWIRPFGPNRQLIHFITRGPNAKWLADALAGRYGGEVVRAASLPAQAAWFDPETSYAVVSAGARRKGDDGASRGPLTD